MLMKTKVEVWDLVDPSATQLPFFSVVFTIYIFSASKRLKSQIQNLEFDDLS